MTEVGPAVARRLGTGFADLFMRVRDMSHEGMFILRPKRETTYFFLPYDCTCLNAPILVLQPQ